MVESHIFINLFTFAAIICIFVLEQQYILERVVNQKLLAQAWQPPVSFACSYNCRLGLALLLGYSDVPVESVWGSEQEWRVSICSGESSEGPTPCLQMAMK